MLARLSLVALASLAVARPIASDVMAAVSNALQLPSTVQTNDVAYYYQNGNAGACSLYSKDSDKVVGLPLEFYNETGSVSPYCGSYIVITNLVSNETVTARVADASATKDLLSLSIGTWDALDGAKTNLETVTWRFATDKETAAAEAALSSSSPAATTTQAAAQDTTAAAATTTSKAAQQQQYTTSSAAAAVVAAAQQETTEQAYTQKQYTTTTTKWVAPTTTSTKEWVAPTTTQKSSSSSSGGSYSGQATYFYQNGVAGACGGTHSDSDYIVAIDQAMYNGGANCGRSVTINGNGNSVTATVADMCPTCASSGSLDLSVAAFNALASESAGVVSITWSFNN